MTIVTTYIILSYRNEKKFARIHFGIPIKKLKWRRRFQPVYVHSDDSSDPKR